MLPRKRLALFFFVCICCLLCLASCAQESRIEPRIPHRMYDLILFSEGQLTFAGLGSGTSFDDLFPDENSKAGYDFSTYESDGVVTSTTEYDFTSTLDPWQLNLFFAEGVLVRVSCSADLKKSPHELNCDTVLSIQQSMQQVIATHYGDELANSVQLIDCDALKAGAAGMQTVSWELGPDNGARVTVRAENLDATPYQSETDNQFVVFCEVELQFAEIC